MKAIVAIFFVVLASAAEAATVELLQSEAEIAYAARDYNTAGILKAQEAADLYAKAAAQATDPMIQARLYAAQSEALYFVGNATSAKDLKKRHHLEGMSVADKSLLLFGISDVQKVDSKRVDELKKSLSADSLRTLGNTLYYRGINLGQWGAANGVVDSLGKWPELRDTMELINNLGLRELHEYGATRTLGRGYHQIPALLGGNLRRAERLLQTALEKTRVSGDIFSTNGYNNTFYAEVLRDSGKDDEGRALLEAFIKADASTLHPGLVPENRRAQEEARELLKSW